VAVWLVMIVVNAAAAQAIVVAGGWNRRPSPRWTALSLPDWLSWLLVGAAVAGLAAGGDLGYGGRNLVVVAAVPFFFLGLAVVHGVVGRGPGRGFRLFGLYLLLVLMCAGVAPLIAAVGRVAAWAGLRRSGGAAGFGKGNE